MKGAVIILSTLLLFASCGYHIAGFSSETPTRFYINTLSTTVADSAYRDIVQNTVERYFVDYGELSSYKRATYILDMKLTDLSTSNSTVNAFEEATTSNIRLTLLMVVKDLENREVFTYTINTDRTYAVSYNVAQTKMAEKSAIETLLQNSLSDFRIAFANKAYSLDRMKEAERERFIPILTNKPLLINLNEKLNRAQNNTLIEAYKNAFFKEDKTQVKKERARVDLSK